VNLFALAPALFATATKAKTTSSGPFLIFIVIVVAALYFLFLRPNQQRAKKARSENSSINVGDRVVSIGGIVGTIKEMEGDRVVLLTGNPEVESDDSQPTRLVLLRSAIARKVDVPSVPLHDIGEDDDQSDAEEDEDAENVGNAEEETGTAEGDAGA
jgi:preprotein translocase subunit YajC